MLTIRKVYKADELKRFKELEGKYHYMGKTHSGGETMRLVIEDGGEWVALMVWGSACYRLKPRDEFIGWAPSLRAARQKLVVSNRRFTILAAPGTRKNLASQCLALACRELPELWLRRFHYRPLLAETFCDIERTAGTCYKAANWIPLGLTKGYTRVNRQERDFFIPNERPKTVWVYPLAKDAVETLNAPTLPATCEAGAHSDADGVLPVSPALGESLYDAMTRVRDTRDDNRSIPSASVLALVVMAMMSGANSVKAIWRFGERLTMAQRKALHFPHDKDRVGKVLKAYYKIPRYETIYKFLRQLDLEDFAARLSEWLSAQSGLLPRQIAVDGKFIKEVMGVVSAVDAASGAPVAVAPTSRKEGEKGACELPVARRMLGRMDLSNAIVSGDALHCQDATARTILDGNGEYLLQVKGNQGGVLRAARAICRGRLPDDVKKK